MGGKKSRLNLREKKQKKKSDAERKKNVRMKKDSDLPFR